MHYTLTAAAERALVEAAAWSLGEFSDALEAPAVLLGLLAESECRAAATLARQGIDADAVLARWPSLVRMPNRYAAWGEIERPSSPCAGGMPVRQFSPEVKLSIATVVRRLRKCGLPNDLGTEHLLLGLAISGHEVSEWIAQRGVDSGRYQEETFRAQGYQPPSTTLVLAEDAQLSEVEEPLGPLMSMPLAELSLTPHSSVLVDIAPTERTRVLRVIDATANRAREGVRVVEDYVRFVLDDRFLTNLLKALRHDLTGVLSRFPSNERLAARDTLADVGTVLATAGEQRREGTASVAAANFARLQESLRSLEEFAKILDPAASAEFEQIRYRTYTIQRAVETTRGSLERLGHARLYVLLDGRSTLDEFCRMARSLATAGAHVIQLRDKHLDDRTLIGRARALREIATEQNVVFIMNDRPDLAVLARADGVHVGQEELSVKDARAIVGPRAMVGVSTHSIQQARQAVLDGADYIGVGPVFPSETKHFERCPGIDLLREVAAEIRLPAFAIGGIDLGNISLVLQAGLCRVAVGAAISAAADPAAAAREFLDKMGDPK